MAQPQRHTFPVESDLEALVRQVMDAVRALPVYFQTATHIEGLEAADLFSLNAVLGSTIEVQVDITEDIALGIELKGWYLLSKEREPSFRYAVTPQACARQDLLAVVPWHLRNVLSGEPVVYEPYIEQARYAAE